MKIRFILFVFIFSNCYVIAIGNEDQSAGPGKPTKFRVMSVSSLWLMELEENYKSGFPKQFSVINHRNLSTVRNHNLQREDASTCQDVTFFSVEQNKRMINTFGWDSILNRTIHEILEIPRARLFRDNFDGEIEDYHYSRGKRHGFCTKLVQLQRLVESVYTFGKCVRLFETTSCGGWSVAVYPGSINSAKLMRPKGVTFQSIGPCLENEFSGGDFNVSFPRFVLKNPKSQNFNPDSLIMSNTLVKSPYRYFEGVSYNYVFGPGNRIECIRAVIKDYRRNGLQTTALENETFMKYPEGNSDVLGYTIPPHFSGTEEKFNRFPADRSSLNRWYAVLARFLTGSWYLQSDFVYEDKTKTRPMYFYFLITIINNNSIGKIHNWKHYYGRITNEHPRIWTGEQSFIQDVEQNNGININMSYIETTFSSIFNVEFYSRNCSGSYFNKAAEIHRTDRVHCQQGLSNQKESQELTEYLYNFQQLAKEMLTYPMVRLFSGENFTGNFEDFHSGMEDGRNGCFDTRRIRNVKSAVTFNKCTRLFEHTSRRGLSIVIYPEIQSLIISIDKILKNVSSVGKCLVKEFLNPQNYSDVPDIVEISETTLYKRKDFSFPGVNIHYRLGRFKRIECIKATVIQFGLVPTGKRINDIANVFNNSRYMREGYVPSYVIPLAIGGPSNKSFNVFPVKRSRSEDWPKVFPSNLSDPNEIIKWKMSFKFVYKTERNTRPIYIYYHFISLLNERVN